MDTAECSVAPFADRGRPAHNTVGNLFGDCPTWPVQPDGWHTVTPRIVVPDPHNLIEFIRTVFHAQGEYRLGCPRKSGSVIPS